MYEDRSPCSGDYQSMTDAELEAAMLAARDEIDRQLAAELAADPQRDERLLARIIAASATHKGAIAMTMHISTSPATTEPATDYTMIVEAAQALLTAAGSTSVPVSADWHEELGTQNGRYVLHVCYQDGQAGEIYGPITWVQHGWCSAHGGRAAATAIEHALAVLTHRGALAVTAQVVRLVAEARLGRAVTLTERQTKGDGVAYTFAAEGAGGTMTVTLHQGHLLAESDDEWLVPAGRSWRTVEDPIAYVTAELATDTAA